MTPAAAPFVASSAALARRVAPLVLFVLVWQSLGTLHLVNTSFLPSPMMVGRALGDLLSGHEIRDNLLVTLWRAVVGLIAGSACGIAVGVGMARSQAFRGYLAPIVGATYSLPKTALVPLLILWLGVGDVMAMAAVFLTCLLPVVVHTFHGVTATPPVLVWSAQALGASRRQVLWRILLPHALPDIFTGLRIAMGFAFVVAISAEMIASTAGIGRLTFMYGENGAYDYMFAAIASVVVVAFLADRALLWLGALCLRWHEAAAGEGA
ncbi:MAG TPA: ABC transporter permease [Xanthobacteraceae bacterium]|jgi:NitT/TauT family transport system permease protein